jgi:hypothetical protein
MRRRRSERERTDENPQRGAATAPEPRRHQLERRRVDAREEEARRRPERQREPRPVGGEDEGVRDRRPERTPRDDVASIHHVGEVEDARDERAGNEAELDGDRQPCGSGARQVPVVAQLRDHRRRREPCRHGEHE